MSRTLWGWLVTCEGNLDATIGLWKTWDGLTVLHLLNEIEHVHGKLWTSHTSRDNLEKARQQSVDQTHALLWDSSFVRELVLSAMGGLDVGKFYTRSISPDGRL